MYRLVAWKCYFRCIFINYILQPLQSAIPNILCGCAPHTWDMNKIIKIYIYVQTKYREYTSAACAHIRTERHVPISVIARWCMEKVLFSHYLRFAVEWRLNSSSAGRTMLFYGSKCWNILQVSLRLCTFWVITMVISTIKCFGENALKWK